MAKANETNPPKFMVSVKNVLEEDSFFTNFTVVTAGVIVVFEDEEGKDGEALIPWHRVNSISSLEVGSLNATFPL